MNRSVAWLATIVTVSLIVWTQPAMTAAARQRSPEAGHSDEGMPESSGSGSVSGTVEDDAAALPEDRPASVEAARSAPQEDRPGRRTTASGLFEYDPIERGPATRRSIPSLVTPSAERRVPAPRPAPKSGPMAAATTSVQLRASEPVPVERYDRRRGEWLTVCVAPCLASVPVGSRLRVPRDVRHDVAGSRRFRLHEGLRAATIDVRGGSVKQRAAGAGLALMSIVGVIGGIMMIQSVRGLEVANLRASEGYYVIPISTIFVAVGIGITVSGKSRLRQRRAPRVAAMPGGIAF